MKNIIISIISEITGLELYEVNCEAEFDLSMDEDEIFDLFDTLESQTELKLLNKRKALTTANSLYEYIKNNE
jgi:hypothetical protein